MKIYQYLIDSDKPAADRALTLALLVPVCCHMFRAGRRGAQQTTTTTSIQRRQLLWGATNSALAFFLASFQVHEKSLLLALAPCSLLLPHDASFVEWFSVVAAWTLPGAPSLEGYLFPDTYHVDINARPREVMHPC